MRSARLLLSLLHCFGLARELPCLRGRRFRGHRFDAFTGGICSSSFLQTALFVIGLPWRICAARRTGNSCPFTVIGEPSAPPAKTSQQLRRSLLPAALNSASTTSTSASSFV